MENKWRISNQVRLKNIILFIQLFACVCCAKKQQGTSNGSPEETIRTTTESLKADKKDYDSYLMRGVAYKELGKLKDALSDYNNAIKFASASDDEFARHSLVEAYNMRGSLYNRSGRKDEALLDYDKAIELNPKNDYAYYHRGIMRVEMGQSELGCADLKKASEILPVVDIYNDALEEYCK